MPLFQSESFSSLASSDDASETLEGELEMLVYNDLGPFDAMRDATCGSSFVFSSSFSAHTRSCVFSFLIQYEFRPLS